MAHRKGRLEDRLDEEAAKYTSSLLFDREILEAVVYVNAAHLKALARAGVISWSECEEAVNHLADMLRMDIDYTRYELEDIHMIVEDYLASKMPKAAAMLSLGKSRNDAVVAAVKIRLRERLISMAEALLGLVLTLLKRASEEADTLFPTYTHLQRAAPATFGFITHSYAIRLMKLLPRIKHTYSLCQDSPLGSAAVAGTSVGLDVSYEAELLGFSKVCENALEATASREFIIDALCLCAETALVISCLAEELVLFSSEEFQLLELPDSLSSTSSIMPQKKNPVVAEVARTKAAELLGLFSSAYLMAARQPSGYNLDLQQITPKLWKALDEVEETLAIMAKAVEGVKVNRERAALACSPPTAVVELANYLTLKWGIPFRQAHNAAAAVSRLMAENRLNEESLKETLERYNIPGGAVSMEQLRELLEPGKVVRRYATPQSANPDKIREKAGVMSYEAERELRWFKEEGRRIGEKLRNLLGSS
ncbi:MAG TPA: argininosuccinate lyase [Candidatus Caldiarchaeum subterraneum]|uniref:Argininosuccinate lyase n=1 Tax=Caldiarchaeum subterraneum TaxID=311458 RepID=A0A833E9Y1_CALS0|nr:argininosuccinate lyase [Aigarchaeota archaeon]HIQ29684.1 argininosuccinate lyase [Candidatus Caldarchaeum subterraneum]